MARKSKRKGFTKAQQARLDAYDGPITHCPSAPAVGAYYGICNTPEEDLTGAAGGEPAVIDKRRGSGRGRIRHYGNFIYRSD